MPQFAQIPSRDPPPVQGGRDQCARNAQLRQSPYVVRGSHAASRDEREVREAGTRSLQGGPVGASARAHLIEGQEYHLGQPLAREEIESGRWSQTTECRAAAEDAVDPHVQAEKQLSREESVPDLPQGLEAGKRFRAHYRPRRTGVDDPRGRGRVDDRGVHPEFDSEPIGEKADHRVVISRSLDRVQIGDVERGATRLPLESLSYGKRLGAGSQDAFDRAVVFAVTLDAVDHLPLHQV